MININEKSECCGCGACCQICPEKCVKMAVDEEGFAYPSVSMNGCMKCGLCEKVCPIRHSVLKNAGRDEKPLAFATYAKNERIRMQSSSGGMFTLFAEKILQQKGIIFGAAFDDDFYAHHVSAENNVDLGKMRGSKYMQSRIEDTYYEAKQALIDGRTVLFTGTACQIAGLKGYLCKDYENLYTVDVLCHGVPSPKVWKKYLQEQERLFGGVVQQAFFRKKKFGWKAFAVELQFSNSTMYEQIFSKDLFMQMFLSNICLRPSCYVCRFKGLDRRSDLTIGDCWGIHKTIPDMDDDNGTSVVLIHSDKGQRFFENLKKQTLYREAPVDLLLPPTSGSRKSVKSHPKRARFFRMLNRGVNIRQLARITKPSLVTRTKNIIGFTLKNRLRA